MKRLNSKTYAAPLVLVALLSACSGPTENAGSSNTNAPEQANSNSVAQPSVAQSNAPSIPPRTVQQLPPPQPKAADAVNPAEKSPSNPNANSAGASRTRFPKLVAPDKKVDFGKQPQDKTLVRVIAIRNAGRADLKIESVSPS